METRTSMVLTNAPGIVREVVYLAGTLMYVRMYYRELGRLQRFCCWCSAVPAFMQAKPSDGLTSGELETVVIGTAKVKRRH